MNPTGFAGRGIGLTLTLALVAVALAGGWRLNRAYPAESEVWAASVPPDAVVFDARGPLSYAGGHLPGARQLWSRDLLSYAGPVPQTLADPEALADRFSAAGLTPGDTAVVYDDGGGADAPLVAMVLAAFGVEARVLVGGAAQWVAAGGTLETGASPPVVAEDGDWTFDDLLLVPTGEIAAHLTDALVAPVDLRDSAAYAALHLEQAVSVPAASLVPSGSLPRWSEMAGLLSRARIADDTHVLLYGADLAEAARGWLALRAFGREHLHVVAGPFELLGAAGLPMTSAPLARAESKRTSSVCWGKPAAAQAN